jgi:hypothetical protein
MERDPCSKNSQTAPDLQIEKKGLKFQKNRKLTSEILFEP